MSSGDIIDVEGLRKKPYSSVICYPRASIAEVAERLKELKQLRISALEFSGNKEVYNLHVLGKGCVGIVVTALRNREKVALKIRRTDADRGSMRREAEFLKVANSLGVGPRLIDVCKDFLLMQLIEGELLVDWRESHGVDVIRPALRLLLEQCWRLDQAGLDHGELSCAPKHVIVGGGNEPVIVDFETASLGRKPSNVTSICQFLFVGSRTARELAHKLAGNDASVVVGALRRYKTDKSRENFDGILAACGLQTTYAI